MTGHIEGRQPDQAARHRRGRWAVLGIGGVVLVLWGAVFVAWWYNSLFDRHRRLDPERAGQFGDTFGVVNALFSGVALVGVAYAVVLQHEELEVAKQEARDSETARKRADAALSVQAAIQVASAKLQAANALAQTYRALEELHTARVAFTRNTDREQLAKYCQLQEICLVEIAHLERGARKGVVIAVDPYKAFLAHYVKAQKREFDEGWNQFQPVQVRQFIMQINEQIFLLWQQDATQGTTFGNELYGARAQWLQLVKRMNEEKWDTTSLRQDVLDAILGLLRITT